MREIKTNMVCRSGCVLEDDLLNIEYIGWDDDVLKLVDIVDKNITQLLNLSNLKNQLMLELVGNAYKINHYVTMYVLKSRLYLYFNNTKSFYRVLLNDFKTVQYKSNQILLKKDDEITILYDAKTDYIAVDRLREVYKNNGDIIILKVLSVGDRRESIVYKEHYIDISLRQLNYCNILGCDGLLLDYIPKKYLKNKSLLNIPYITTTCVVMYLNYLKNTDKENYENVREFYTEKYNLNNLIDKYHDYALIGYTNKEQDKLVALVLQTLKVIK